MPILNLDAAVCTACGAEKPRSEFRPTPSGGIRRKCWECYRASSAEAARGYRLRHPDRHRESVRRSLAKTGRAVEYTRRWQRKNKDRVRENMKRWWAENKDKRRDYDARKKQKRRAVRGVDVVTAQQIRWRRAMFGGCCWICGRDAAGEMDHVKPLLRGGRHIAANLRPACRTCNTRKNAIWPFHKEAFLASA